MANVQGKYTKTLKGLGLALKIAIDEQCLCNLFEFYWTTLSRYW